MEINFININIKTHCNYGCNLGLKINEVLGGVLRIMQEKQLIKRDRHVDDFWGMGIVKLDLIYCIKMCYCLG